MDQYPKLSQQAYHNDEQHRKEVIENIVSEIGSIWRYYCSQKITDVQFASIKNYLEDTLPKAPTEQKENNLQKVHELFNCLIKERNYAKIDSMLDTLVLADNEISALLTILTYTARSNVREHLKNREKFYTRCQDYLIRKIGVVACNNCISGLE